MSVTTPILRSDVRGRGRRRPRTGRCRCARRDGAALGGRRSPLPTATCWRRCCYRPRRGWTAQRTGPVRYYGCACVLLKIQDRIVRDGQLTRDRFGRGQSTPLGRPLAHILATAGVGRQAASCARLPAASSMRCATHRPMAATPRSSSTATRVMTTPSRSPWRWPGRSSDLLAITTVAGNAPLDRDDPQRAAGPDPPRPDGRAGRGRRGPSRSSGEPWVPVEVHGASGLDGADLPEPAVGARRRSARWS